jgi:hypothetical protein
MKQNFRLYLKNIKQLVQISENKEPFKKMKDCTDISIKKNVSIVIGHDGYIQKIGNA